VRASFGSSSILCRIPSAKVIETLDPFNGEGKRRQ
jgi:hypothetical protein